MIVKVRDTDFASRGREMIKQRAFVQVTEEPPVGIGPTTYALRGPPTPPPPLATCDFARIGSLDGAATASLDSSSRHNPRHDSAFNESWTSFSSDRGSQLARGFRPPAL